MTENIENIEKSITIESKGTKDLILQEMRVHRENQQLRKDNQLLSDELAYFKERCADLEDEINKLQEAKTQVCIHEEMLVEELETIKNMGMFEFADKYCTEKDHIEAGHQLARSLGVGVRMTDAEVAIDKAENCYIPYTGDDF